MNLCASISYVPAVLLASLVTAILASEKAHGLSVWLIISIWLGLTIIIWLLFHLPWERIFSQW